MGDNGVFGQFISFGGSDYIEMNETTDDIVQIAWDSKEMIRLAYTAENIYQTGYGNPDDCLWDENDIFDVLIQIDTEKIMVSDELCQSVSVANHTLGSTQTIVTLGFIDDDKYD